ncbi:hypothetical protein SAMN04487928_13811 [Butyrivibrio proteoclasticus]|uniref:Uncharacterized protein n=1 Tax=Butyrivibrio proteoclasticus TaxID=43305 RepID=A0A1I5XWK2_9FIRM|nr:hypothetical protein [Butyrivibrio proteoclasticus]SFQ36304.1 hypothetical protein SAMN04487928_13811 [Butyrivibrio proteoclasticus]
MIKPTLLSPEESKINDKVWELRIKYNTLDAFTENLDDSIFNYSVEDFKKITKAFKTPSEYALALADMHDYIENGLDVPQELYEKIQKVRKDFSKKLVK